MPIGSTRTRNRQVNADGDRGERGVYGRSHLYPLQFIRLNQYIGRDAQPGL
jgi:hypothetical protein